MTHHYTFQKASITAEAAWRILAAAEARAREVGIPSSIAITDESGVLKAFSRMDGAALLTVQIAQDKAYTASSFGMATDGWYMAPMCPLCQESKNTLLFFAKQSGVVTKTAQADQSQGCGAEHPQGLALTARSGAVHLEQPDRFLMVRCCFVPLEGVSA